VNTPADVIAKLATLGEPRQIADHLLAQGIRGDHRTDTCPVARYVHQETGQRVSVGSPFWSAGDTLHRIPGELARFVQAYDFGFFPELEHEDES
jgi:hypothetical protein